MKGEPIAYILGYKDFYGLQFKVNKNVLIPRPETEILIERILARVIPSQSDESRDHSNKQKAYPPSSLDVFQLGRSGKIKILDVGTGSGCIAIAIAKGVSSANRRAKFQIAASDISLKALTVAKQNAKKLLSKNSHTLEYGRIRFFKSDLLKNIKQDYDIMIANLPYGWQAWKNNTSAASAGLKFEPQIALFTEEQGLYLYRLLLEQVAIRKRQPKLIYFEYDPRQRSLLRQLVKKNLPRSRVKFYKDFRGLWRYLEIKLYSS